MLNNVKLELELELENECSLSGIAEFRKKGIARLTKGQESLTGYGIKITSLIITPLSQAITRFVAEASQGAGRNHLAVKPLRSTDPDVAAFIAARTAMEGISRMMPYQKVSILIGDGIEEEAKYTHFEKKEKSLYFVVNKSLKDNPDGYSRRTRRRNLNHNMKKFAVEWSPWPHRDRFLVGSKLLDLMIEATGMLEIIRPPKLNPRRNDMLRVGATSKLLEFISNFKDRSETLYPLRMPMICPPKPWTTPFDGGYHSTTHQKNIINGRHENQMKQLIDRPMPIVYSAINTLQNTAWRINAPMLDIAHEAWENGVDVAGLPLRYKLECPAKPEFDAESESSRLAYGLWKQEKAIIGRKNRENMSRMLAARKVFVVADRFRQYEQVYFPATLDFRGRLYFLPQGLNPQSSDLSRGLLQFAEAKPLGSSGVRWLAIHTANTFGNDKVNMDDRVQWVLDHSSRIDRMAGDPLNDLWWTEADKPFQFLAACIEWSNSLMANTQAEYPCSLPVAVDGSCNGLQHFSAMLRDRVCGDQVNLTSRETPGDIYAAVAAEVCKALEGDGSDMARLWLDYGIDRKVCKRPVMVLPYGGTRQAVRKYLTDHVDEQKNHNLGKRPGKAVSYLATVVWEAMARVVIKPMEGMHWIQKAAKSLTDAGHPIIWTTPTNFLVEQRYQEMESRKVKTKIGDVIYRVSLQEELDKMDKRKQRTALAPNFVHSLDASALMNTVNLCATRGIHSFLAIHDSYGTHACDMDVLSTTLREAFVEIYTADDVLGKLRDEMQTQLGKPLPECPSRGSLDISGVLRSCFFFA